MTDLTMIDESAENLILNMIYHGIFLVDCEGRIWRTATVRKGKLVPCESRRAEYNSRSGYMRMRVSVNGVRIRVSAHRIVYRYFNDGASIAMFVVDHDNEVRWDNRPENLSAVTQQKNVLLSIERKKNK